MENVMNFLKENFYYVLGAFIIFVVIIVVIVSCSSYGGSTVSYEKLEVKMVNAAKEYYKENKSKLPKGEDETVSISLAYLVSNKYIKEIKDPKDRKKICSGEIQVTKRNKTYNYQAFLSCGKNYKTQFLVDALKESKRLDDNANGLYKVGDEYIFRGDKLKNYVKFNNELWRVLKIDSSGDIKLIKNKPTEEQYVWDDRYNVTTKENNGVNNFKLSRIRDTLNAYYKSHFNKVEGAKGKIVKKDWCVGNRKETDAIDNSVECLEKMPMYLGMITTSEYYLASLDKSCKAYGQEQCENYNFLADFDYSYWTLNGNSTKSDRVFSVYYGEMEDSYANSEKTLMPVIYIDTKVISKGGSGTMNNPFIVR